MLRKSSPEQEGVFQGSNWYKVSIAAGESVWQELLQDDLFLYRLGAVGDGKPVVRGDFLKALHLSKEGDPSPLKPFLAIGLSDEEEAFYQQEVGEGRWIVRPIKPLVQLKASYCTFSDGKLHLDVFGKETFFFGVQLSYPQIFQDPKTEAIYKSTPSKLLLRVREWIRSFSKPVFLGKMATPLRQGIDTQRILPWTI